MGVFKKGNDWYIDYHVNGRRKREKVGPSKRLAESVLAKRKVEIAEGKFLDIERKLKVRFEDFAKEYMEYSKANKRSWKRDVVSLKNLLPVFGDKYLAEITPLMVEQYKNRRRDQVTPATVNREMALLKNMFNKAIQWGKAAENLVAKVKLFKEDKGRLRLLTEEELERLLEVAPPHLQPILVVALNTGLRKSEILNLKWDDVDFQQERILVADAKNREWREIPMNLAVFKALVSIERHPESPYVFCKPNGQPYGNVRKSFEKALRIAGIENFRFHDLRHTFASHLVMAGVDLMTVKELLGHKSLEMTMRYSHLSPAHKRKAVDLLLKNA